MLGQVVGNVGFIFTKGDLKETKKQILSNRIAAPAKAGAIAPNDVTVPGGNTGIEPGKTSFFQALAIPTKISRGTIEIINDVSLIKAGNKVGASEAALLNMLNISPFTYGMTVVSVFEDGNLFSPAVLDVSDEDLIKHYTNAITTVACISLAIHYPTVAAVPHQIVKGYKDLLAVGMSLEGYSFAALDKVFYIFAMITNIRVDLFWREVKNLNTLIF